MERELTNALRAYGSDPNVEIEARFGWITGTQFSSDTEQEFHAYLETHLFDRFHDFASVSVETYTTVTKNGVRSTYTANGDHRATVRKSLISNADFRAHGTPFDVRVSVKSETPVAVNEPKVSLDDPDAYKRTVHRSSFCHHTGWIRMDLSRVDDPPTFEFELEIMKPLRVTPEYLSRFVVSEITNLILVPPEDSHLKGYELVKRTHSKA